MDYKTVVCDANHLYSAYLNSIKGSKWKETTQSFMLYYLRYIFRLQNDLLDRTYKNSPADEYENLNTYLYEPYKKLGGNGSALRVMQEVNKLPIRNQCFEGMGGK